MLTSEHTHEVWRTSVGSVSPGEQGRGSSSCSGHGDNSPSPSGYCSHLLQTGGQMIQSPSESPFLTQASDSHWSAPGLRNQTDVVVVVVDSQSVAVVVEAQDRL